MGYALDILLLCIIAIFIIVGIRRGFIRSALRLVGAVLAACLSAFFGGIVAEAIFTNLIRPGLIERIGEMLAGVSVNDGIYGLLDSLPDFLVRGLDAVGVTAESLSKMLTAQQGQAAEIIADEIAPMFIGFLKVLAVIVLFMIFMMIVRILTGYISRLFRLPLLNGANSLLGGLFGFLQALVMIWVVLAMVGVFVPILETSAQQAIEESMSNSIISNIIVSFNPFDLMFR